ncbi:BTAD domain-containing putative transcriptional regulator [Streptomyces sp. NPDC017201]|uniref:BTAD domain-containing putative transcriptional regulator n=1 Tax=unclassified Streptomyces TaxID=2593676 RepID=UPI0029B1C425|nr:BTAD domain-containing putative transcriptional regulator [Streptomyces sp. ME01-18a]MDX3427887.1 BTAD domain-containing putative transcriptional regulator [Streptomyces sp. ME01-18a]
MPPQAVTGCAPVTRTPRRSCSARPWTCGATVPTPSPPSSPRWRPAAAIRLAHVSVEAVADLAVADLAVADLAEADLAEADLAEAELALGRADAAASRLTALLAERPVQERAAALLMDALAAQGRQAEALAR